MEAGPGRPPGWRDPDVRREILEAIEEHCTYELAAWSAGISYETLRRWRALGEQEDADPELARFCVALKRSEAKAARESLRSIRTATKDDVWVNHGWLLERRHGYVRAERVEHSGAVRTGDKANDPREVLREELDDLPPEVRKSLAGG